MSETVRFSLLGQTAEQGLQKQLAEWEGQSGLIRPLGRAYVFHSFSLLNEAADAYEAALAEDSDSTQLLIAAIAAQRQIGNTEREQILRRRLPHGAKVPGDKP